jgi:holo-[acyl-carrier protein] synthase
MRRKNPAPHLAGRFAAKEAGMKAIGTGHAFGVLWKDLEVVRHGGPPQLQFHNAAARHFVRVGASQALLTITHTDSLALAHVILVSESRT